MSKLISTALSDDPDPNGTDVYGMIPLIAEIPSDDDDESGADDEARPPIIEASSIEIDLPRGKKLPDDDDEAFEELTSRGGVSPGEAKALVKYMRPLSEDEREIAENPYLNDLRWVDDPAHVDDLLKEGRGDKGLDDFLDDAIYGDAIMNPRKNSRRLPTKVLNRAVLSGLTKKLVVEHANWLAGKDQEMGITVRPRSYYENVARLWANDKLNEAALPTTTSGNWGAHPRKVVTAAERVLNNTMNARLRFAPVLGGSVDMGGWSPWHAIKSAAKSLEHGVEKGAGLAYRTAKFGLTKPFEYTYKGIKYVGEQAMRLALAPIKAVVSRFRNKMVNRKASELAQQRGLAAPGPTEKAQALAWTKSTTARSGNKFARMATSLMGTPNSAEMGLAPIALYPLIALGAVGLMVILDGIYKAAFKHGSSAPVQDPNDPGAADPSATDPNQGSPAEAPDTVPPDDGSPDDGAYDTSGYSRNWKRPSVTIEQLNRLPSNKRQRARQLIRSGYIHLA